MDNPLTPNKIQRLMYLAEDKSFNLPRRLLLNDEDADRLAAQGNNKTTSTANYESSSGIIDLEQVEGFGETMGSISLSKSTIFNPGEITGRSTGTDDIDSNSISMLSTTRTFDEYGRHSLALDSITLNMDKQTSEINDIMRHSVATNYSFNSKRDLTRDEASFIIKEAPLPILHKPINIQDSIITNNTNMSVGAYFKTRCEGFDHILEKTDSPDRSYLRPSITEVSTSTQLETPSKEKPLFCIDETLDSVPVRQPRNTFITERVVNNKTERLNNYITNKTSVAMELPKAKQPANRGSEIQKHYLPNHLSEQIRSAKATDILIKNLQSSMKFVSDDTEGSIENSFSISRIADYLGKESHVSPTDMLQNMRKKQVNKQPLSELHMNTQDQILKHNVQVTYLKDTSYMDACSSSGTAATVVSLDKMKNQENNIPQVVVTKYSFENAEDSHIKQRSKSPSSKSRSTLSTVEERTSFKSDSPLQTSKGEVNISHFPSPNVVYKELDKSVDWHEVLEQKRFKQEGFAKEKWVEITTTPENGFVGVNSSTTITVTTLIDSWLTPTFKFDELPQDAKGLSIELARPFPLLISPAKPEQFTVLLTSCAEINTEIPFTLSLSDTSNDKVIEQKGVLTVNIKMPTLQTISSEGFNSIVFPIIQENSSFTKTFILISDCPGDLQLKLSVVEGENMFSIRNIQEIKKTDVNKALKDPGCEDQRGKAVGKNSQVCKLTSGNAIQLTMAFHSPKLSDKQLVQKVTTVNGAMNVGLLGVNTVLKIVGLMGTVGYSQLALNIPGNKLELSNEPTTITLSNTGSVGSTWVVKFVSNSPNESCPFKVSATRFEIPAGGNMSLSLRYTGTGDKSESVLKFEDLSTAKKTLIEICAGADKPSSFPIKTNTNNMTWVRTGRKDLSLKNSTDKKVHIRCQIIGEGFSIDLPGDSRGVYCLAFGSGDCRSLPIVFSPASGLPQTATLHLVYDKNSDFSRKVVLHGCGSSAALRWWGHVTYGDTALVRALSRQHLELNLYNKAAVPAFIAAKVHFNLQYQSIAASAQLVGGRRVVPARSHHTLQLRVDWARVERTARASPAAALASLTVLAGAEFTRLRILRIIRDEATGNLDLDSLPEHLKILAEDFEGEDPAMAKHLTNFKETKASLKELVSGMQELTAQIDLPPDFTDDNTILITDDTVLEHHTLRE